MTGTGPRNNKRFLRWIAWAIVLQVILLNVSSALYGYKLTYFFNTSSANETPAATNVFAKTWRLFTGPRFQKSPAVEFPHYPFQQVTLRTKSGLAIDSWLIPADSSAGTVVLVHGLGQNKSMLLNEAYEFLYFGYSVLLLDLRAHGNSEGNVCTVGYRESEEVGLAYDYLAQKGEKTVFFYGVSLGATVIMKAVHDDHIPAAGLILEIPFESVESLFGKRLRMLGFPEEPFGALATFWASMERGFNGFRQKTSRFGNGVGCAVLLQSAAMDRLVSRRETAAIYKSIATRNKRWIEYEGAGHEFLLGDNPAKWRKEIREFLLANGHLRITTLAPRGK
ncbi:MAG TPA: alpha/beta fold hydrolase [Chitinophagaceae bacterium]